MANYRSIHVKIWADPKVEDLNPNSKLLFVYLLTNTYRNESGLYNITPKKLKDETGIKDIRQAIDDLIEKKIIMYDFEKNVVWVINAIKYQTLNANCVKSIKKDLEYCSSDVLKWEFVDFYKNYEGLQTVMEGFGKPPIGIGLGIGIGIGLGIGGCVEENVSQKPKHPLQKWIEETCPEVSKLKTQLTEDDCKRLLDDFNDAQIKQVLQNMENYKPLLTKYKSVNLTLRKWMALQNARNPAVNQSSEGKTIILRRA